MQTGPPEWVLWFLLWFVYLCPIAPQRDPEHWALSSCLDKSEFSEHLAAPHDEALVCSTVFFFSPCAPHTPCTPGRLPERAEPICMSPEPVDLTWITDWARPPQQVGKETQEHIHMDMHVLVQHGQSELCSVTVLKSSVPLFTGPFSIIHGSCISLICIKTSGWPVSDANT